MVDDHLSTSSPDGARWRGGTRQSSLASSSPNTESIFGIKTKEKDEIKGKEREEKVASRDGGQCSLGFFVLWLDHPSIEQEENDFFPFP